MTYCLVLTSQRMGVFVFFIELLKKLHFPLKKISPKLKSPLLTQATIPATVTIYTCRRLIDLLLIAGEQCLQRLLRSASRRRSRSQTPTTASCCAERNTWFLNRESFSTTTKKVIQSSFNRESCPERPSFFEVFYWKCRKNGKMPLKNGERFADRRHQQRHKRHREADLKSRWRHCSPAIRKRSINRRHVYTEQILKEIVHQAGLCGRPRPRVLAPANIFT